MVDLTLIQFLGVTPSTSISVAPLKNVDLFLLGVSNSTRSPVLISSPSLSVRPIPSPIDSSSEGYSSSSNRSLLIVVFEVSG